MIKRVLKLACLGLLTVVWVQGVLAERFEPLVQMTRIEGNVQVQVPGATSPVPVINMRAYPYGTRVFTGPQSSVEVIFGDRNRMTVSESSELVISEDDADTSRKRIILLDGQIDVDLTDRHVDMNTLVVSTTAGEALAKGGQFAVKTVAAPDMRLTLFTGKTGAAADIFSLTGDLYSVTQLSAGDQVSVSAANDNSLTRIRGVAGEFAIDVRDELEGNYRVEARKDSVVKIWRRLSDVGDRMMVTAIVTKPDQTIEKTMDYIVDAPRADQAAAAFQPTGNPAAAIGAEEVVPTGSAHAAEGATEPAEETMTAAVEAQDEEGEDEWPQLIREALPLPSPIPRMSVAQPSVDTLIRMTVKAPPTTRPDPTPKGFH